MKRIQFLQASGVLCIAAVAGLQPLPAAAQAYPDKPVTLVIPFPPGGTTDVFARNIGNALQGILKQPFIADNRVGAAGNIGAAYVARAKPDGYTLMLGTVGTQAINHYLYKNLPYDPEQDLVPIALVATTPNVIAVATGSKIKSLGDLIAAARAAKAANARPISYASPGIGSSVHLTGAYLEQAAGIDLLHVPFKGVSGSLPAVIGGQVDVLLDNLPSTLAQVKDGSKVRAIAVTSAQRSPELPDVPTAVESGLPGLDVQAWFALYAPKGTPQPIIDRLIDASRTALRQPGVISAHAALGAQPGTLFGADLAAFEKAERARWSALVKERDIRAE
ncbi:tripartite tricarboxylate transporter substrate binding protein [Xylophilus sp. GOD-11R]|uniref:Bug family tripartite tricarboxylate transporter substrate binding protein n=1 Tax=Xylophilus sp. GOD-11R TaxID=3089814 RepID=UPI00298D19EB|nr:tripartite tricarboxylate transporter substrate binding protein [Xylophilus sp. GOD-11R]WPB58976.1 tripartite tricarboxylate transporter substrate binding protein [Xylophilus sp. GOD-11R]